MEVVQLDPGGVIRLQDHADSLRRAAEMLSLLEGSSCDQPGPG
jgi:hypothetical protein